MFSMLMEVGDDTVGDVSVRLDGGEPTKSPPALLHDPIRIRDIRNHVLGPAGIVREAGISGAVTKISMARVTTAIRGLGRTKAWIMKLEDERYPDIAENERACLELARKCRIAAASAAVYEDSVGEKALLVERFDRHWSKPLGLTKVHVEDACQMLDRFPADKYLLSLADVADGIRTIASSPVPQMLELIRRFAFCYLIGDSDQHAKNISMWVNPKTDIRELSPIYDVVCALPYKGIDRFTALKLDGRDTEFTISHFIRFGERYGVNEAAVRHVLLELAEKVRDEVDAMGKLGKFPFNTAKVRRIISDRIDRLVR
jgi:serine/threonine-protein kinase HipA